MTKISMPGIKVPKQVQPFSQPTDIVGGAGKMQKKMFRKPAMPPAPKAFKP
jgi:hypothetical protein